MATRKKRGLGRGLDALLGEAVLTQQDGTNQTLPIDQIRAGSYQPRRDIDPERLGELAESIRRHGVVQPVVVRPREGGGYELVAGERRWRAARLAGLTEIPAVVRRIDDRTALAVALIENIQREDLNPLDQAEALRRFLEEFDLTHQQLAETLGKSRATISNLLRLLELHPQVKQLLAEGRIEMGHARALLGLTGERQLEVARKVADGKMTVRDTEALVKRLQRPGAPSGPADTDPDIRRLQEELSDLLGTRVTIRHSRTGKGRLVIAYEDLEQLEGLLTRFR